MLSELREYQQAALDDIRAHGLGSYHGATRVGLGPTVGGAGQGGGSTVQITGPITVNGVKDPQDFVSKLRDLGLRRQADGNQSSVGGE